MPSATEDNSGLLGMVVRIVPVGVARAYYSGVGVPTMVVAVGRGRLWGLGVECFPFVVDDGGFGHVIR